MDAPMTIPAAAIVAGILLSTIGVPWWTGGCLIVAGCLLLLLLTYLSCKPILSMRINPLHYVWVGLWFAGLGIICGAFSQPFKVTNDDFSAYHLAEGSITDITNGTSGDRATVAVNRLRGRDGSITECSNFTVLLRVNPDLSLSKDIDDRVVFPANFQRINDSPNSFDTGYASRMEKKGILYCTQADDVDIIRTGHSTSFMGLSRNIRDRIETVVEKSPLKLETRKFLISILLGDRSYLDPDIRSRFADAGVAHVLALSGMHVGIIGGILLFIFFPLNFFGLYKWRLLLGTLMLFGYAFLSGMAPSTVRACVMAACMMTAVWHERKNSSWNSLLLAAIIILLFSPMALYDVGFQLSFICVAGLIFFATALNPIDRHEHHRLYNIAALLIATIVATGVSWTLTAYYFGRLSIAFIPTNILILPLLPAYISIAVIALCLSAAGIHIMALTLITDGGYELLTKFVALMSRAGGSLEIQVGAATVALWMAAVANLALALHLHCRKSHRLALGTAAAISAILAIIMIPAKESPSFIVTNNTPTLTRILVKNHGNSETVTFRPGALTVREICGIPIAMLDCNFPEKRMKSPLKCRYLIVSRGFRDKLSDISGHIEADTIVIHQSMRRSRESELLHEADSIGIPAKSLREAPLRVIGQPVNINRPLQ